MAKQDNEPRYSNGISIETDEYWLAFSKDGRGMTRAEALAFITAQGNWPWRLAPATRKLFPEIELSHSPR